MANTQANPEADYSDTLVRAACDGNREAFGELFRSLYGRVHRTVWAMLGDEAEAHDVAQEAWIKAWERKDKYNFQSLYSTWVHRIAINCALDALRKRKRWYAFLGRRSKVVGQRSGDPEPATDDLQPTTYDLRPTTRLENKELGQTIEAAVAELPEDQRTVLVLREYEGYSYAEIAKSLGIQPGTVMSRLHLARKKLQSRLSKELS